MKISDLFRQLNFYRLEAVGLVAAITNFALGLERTKEWWGLSGEKISTLIFLASIVVVIGTMRAEITRVSQGMERGLLFSRNVTRAKTHKEVLNYVRGLGAFGQAVDPHFWFKYAEALDRRGVSDLAMIDICLNAIEQSTIEVSNEDVYYLMYVLVKRVVKNEESYLGTTSIKELVEAAADDAASDFFLTLPLRYPKQITRIIYVNDKDELKRLPDKVRSKLVQQVTSGVDLRYSKSNERLNYGVYGTVAVGLLDETKKQNHLVFDAERVRAHRSRFTSFLQGPTAAVKIVVEDFGAIA